MDLHDIRRQYQLDRLTAEKLLPQPWQQLQLWLEQAMAAKLSDDPTAMTLATADVTGRPSARIVLLKQLDQQGLVFYTNLGSRKAQEIKQNPQVCCHFSFLGLERQAVIYGRASKLSLREVSKYFMSRPRDSQLGAWASQQSKPIKSRQLLEQSFQQMKQKYSQGQIPLPDFWGGFRVEVDSAEFWQGGENRLHDRFFYQPSGPGVWQIERLQP